MSFFFSWGIISSKWVFLLGFAFCVLPRLFARLPCHFFHFVHARATLSRPPSLCSNTRRCLLLNLFPLPSELQSRVILQMPPQPLLLSLRQQAIPLSLLSNGIGFPNSLLGSGYTLQKKRLGDQRILRKGRNILLKKVCNGIKTSAGTASLTPTKIQQVHNAQNPKERSHKFTQFLRGCSQWERQHCHLIMSTMSHLLMAALPK